MNPFLSNKRMAFLSKRKQMFLLIIVLIGIFVGLSLLVRMAVRNWQANNMVTELAVVVVRSGLSLREAPDEQSKTLILIPSGGKVEILGEERHQGRVAGVNGQWRRARYEMNEGWVFAEIDYLYETKAVDKYQVVKPEKGTELRVGPALNSPRVSNLPQRARVHCLLDAVTEPETTRRWVFCEVGGQRGFVRSLDLSNVLYEPQALSNGPFEGMDVTGMPDSYYRRELDRISCSGVANPSDEENCWVTDIEFRGDHFFLFLRDGKVRQILGRSSIAPAGSTMMVNSSHSVGLYCSDPELKAPAHFVLVRSPLPTGVKDSAGGLQFTRAVLRFWVYDGETDRMRPVEPSAGASCSRPNPRNFD